MITSKRTKNVKCIGGNTSDLNYNGSEYVTEKVRPVSSSRATIVGYAHPAYEKTTSILNLFYMIADDTMPSFFKMFATLLDPYPAAKSSYIRTFTAASSGITS